MISTKWFRNNDLDDVVRIRTEVLVDEQKLDNSFVQDIFDSFAKSVIVYENKKAIATGRLIFNDGKYIIDKLCVLKDHRNMAYEDLIIRMLVRKAVDMGTQKTYFCLSNIDISCNPKIHSILERIGFVPDSRENEILTMVKHGDVGGDCEK